MGFWEMAWEYEWATIDQLRLATITDERPHGDITVEEFELIAGESFEIED